ncbi:hypothetical protein DCCM_3187 [Desulfocucumis palustris]|uniref:8-oxo-dGTP diphosphatase n=1 Tax=Desulfocucumis palustris TaxID=1898651 RepID=A0A2L2XCW9_9FIRM|nr:8-oxo-dGTP diphosphatase MutT [Desulfocucumis palustris]GBF34075.1 hypothetical protein DCCM_3187 [Desulfocucumis palustris]
MLYTAVTAALILDNDRVLLAQRKSGAQQSLKWEFPGGKLEAGETPEECLAREIKEELDIDIQVKEIFTAVAHSYGDRNILLLAYLCRRTGGTPSPRDCNDFQWVSLNSLLKYDLAEADLPIAIKLMGERCHHA